MVILHNFLLLSVNYYPLLGEDGEGISGFILHGLKFLSIKLFSIQGYRGQSTRLFKPELDAVKMDPCLSQVYLCENKCD